MYIHIIEIPIYLFLHHYHSPSFLLLFKLLSSSCFISFMSRCTLFTSPLSVILQLSCSTAFLYQSRSCSISKYSLETHLNLFAHLSPLVSALFLTLTRFLSLSFSLSLHVSASLLSLLFPPSHLVLKSPLSFAQNFL